MAKYHGVTFTPYGRFQKPGDQLDPEIIERRIITIAEHFEWIRIYSTTEGHEIIPALAHKHGLKTLVGSFLDRNVDKNEREISSLIDLCNKGVVDLACIGNESIHGFGFSVDDMRAIRNRVKWNIPINIPVGFSAIDWEYEEYPELMEMFDVNMVHCYPFWEFYEIEEASERLIEKYNHAKELSGDKRVIITETGWPTGGARPDSRRYHTPTEAHKYFSEVMAWAKQNDIEIFYFSSYDEPWKTKHCRSHMTSGSVENQWGIWDFKENLKDVFEKEFKQG